MGHGKGIYCYANQGGGQFQREYWALPPGIKILVLPQFFYMSDQILGKKMKKNYFSGRNLTF